MIKLISLLVADAPWGCGTRRPRWHRWDQPLEVFQGLKEIFPLFLFPLLSFSCFSFFFFASFNFPFQRWGGDDEDGDAVQLQEHLQWRANRSAEAWHLEKYVKYIKYLRQGSWKYISHINSFDGWNPAPEDTFEECTSCEEELRANPSHFNQLFDLATDPLEEVFSPKIVNPVLVYYLFYSTRAFFCYHHTISAQLGWRGTWKSSSDGWTSYGTWSNSGN